MCTAFATISPRRIMAVCIEILSVRFCGADGRALAHASKCTGARWAPTWKVIFGWRELISLCVSVVWRIVIQPHSQTNESKTALHHTREPIDLVKSINHRSDVTMRYVRSRFSNACRSDRPKKKHTHARTHMICICLSLKRVRIRVHILCSTVCPFRALA